MPDTEVVLTPVLTEVTITELSTTLTLTPVDTVTEVSRVETTVELAPIVTEYAPAGAPGAPGTPGVGIPEVFVDGTPAAVNFVPLGDGTYGIEVTV